jgi:uncharacterized protein (TIGR00730 family)
MRALVVGMKLTSSSRELDLPSLSCKPRRNFFAVIALDFHDAVLRRAAGTAMPFERACDLVQLALAQAGDHAHRPGAPPLAQNAHDTVVGDSPLARHCSSAFCRHPAPNCPTATAMSRRICVFCGSSPGNGETYLHVARETALAIVRAGFGIVYGGGRVGLMGAVADAALAAGGEVIGVIPRALSQAEVAHHGVTRLHVVESMHERKALMAASSDAFIALPGGFGTMDEFCEILSWRQLGIHDKPIGLLDQDAYFSHLLGLFDGMVARGFLTPSHRQLFVAAPSIGELLDAMATSNT